jgi:hypothetical protein
MKQIHCHAPHPSRKRRDFSFNRFFNDLANPRMSWHVDKETKSMICDYVPKHFHPHGRTAWDSWRLGTRRKTNDKHGDPVYFPENMPKSRAEKKLAAKQSVN